MTVLDHLSSPHTSFSLDCCGGGCCCCARARRASQADLGFSVFGRGSWSLGVGNVAIINISPKYQTEDTKITLTYEGKEKGEGI